MNILLVEDDDNKAKEIIDLIKKEFVYANLTLRRSYQSGMKDIINNQYELILLDMSMPSFDRNNNTILNSFRHYAGRDVLEEMKRRGIVIKTLVVTQFGVFGEGKSEMNAEQLNVLLKVKFPETYLGMVHYNSSLSNWKTDLVDIIKNTSI